MSNVIEIEAKALISRDCYAKLVKLFPSAERFIQTNHYIDSPDRVLAASGVALRIRERGGKFELTLKTPLSQGMLEKSNEITMNEFCALRDFGEFPKCDLRRFLVMLDFNIEDLRILASLSTERIEVEYEGGVLCIDRNSYNGIIDYEVEFEYNNMEGAKKILSDFLTANGIEFEFSKFRKAARALAQYRK